MWKLGTKNAVLEERMMAVRNRPSEETGSCISNRWLAITRNASAINGWLG